MVPPFLKWVIMAILFVLFLQRKCKFGYAQNLAPPGAKSAMQSAMLGDAAVKVRIHVPQEAVQDVLDALDSLLKIEEATRRSDEDIYIEQKQRLLQIQKTRIRDIVQAAFEPLVAAIPNPVTSQVVTKLHAALEGAPAG